MSSLNKSVICAGLVAIAMVVGWATFRLCKYIHYDLTTPIYSNMHRVGKLVDVEVLQGGWSTSTKSIVTTTQGKFTVIGSFSGMFDADVYMAADRVYKCKRLYLKNGHLFRVAQ